MAIQFRPTLVMSYFSAELTIRFSFLALYAPGFWTDGMQCDVLCEELHNNA